MLLENKEEILFMKKKFGFIIGFMLLVVVAGVGSYEFIARRQAGKLVDEVINEWKDGNLGTIGGDFREAPRDVQIKLRPESDSEELDRLLESYLSETPANKVEDHIEENGDFSSELTDEEYETMIKEQYPSIHESIKKEAIKTEIDSSEMSSDEYLDIYQIVTERLDISYKLPLIIKYPLQVQVDVTAPSIEKAYISARKNSSSIQELQSDIFTLLKDDSAGLVTASQTIRFHKSGEKLYAEPSKEITNVLTGGSIDLMDYLIDEIQEMDKQ